MLVKELAARSGVKKRTIESYLGKNESKPSAEAAVSIAKALGVSVEYLVTGADSKINRQSNSLPADLRELMIVSKQLTSKDRLLVLNIARLLKNR